MIKREELLTELEEKYKIPTLTILSDRDRFLQILEAMSKASEELRARIIKLEKSL